MSLGMVTANDTAIVYNPTTFTGFTSIAITGNSWNNTGKYIEGFDFTRTDSRDANAIVESNAGMIVGTTLDASLSIDRPADAPLTISLQSKNGLVTLPASVVIPAGVLLTTTWLVCALMFSTSAPAPL